MSLGPWKLMDSDPKTGIERWFAYDDETDSWHIKTKQYWVGQMLDEAKEQRNSTAGQQFGEFRKVASIPLSIYYDSNYAKARAEKDEKWIKKFLNDSDNQKFRTFDGKV